MLAVIGILYGAAVSYAQKDVKKLVAYSSVSHLGFVMLGLFALNPQGIQGGILQMVNHGLSTGALFLVVGMIYERRHTREMDAFGGLWKVMPVYGALTLIVALSSMGLPGLNGFVGEFTILLGACGASRRIGSPLVCRAGGAGRDPGGGLHPVHVPEAVPRPGRPKMKTASSEGPELARDCDPGPAAGLHLLDRPVPEAVLRPDGAGGGPAGRRRCRPRRWRCPSHGHATSWRSCR